MKKNSCGFRLISLFIVLICILLSIMAAFAADTEKHLTIDAAISKTKDGIYKAVISVKAHEHCDIDLDINAHNIYILESGQRVRRTLKNTPTSLFGNEATVEIYLQTDENEKNTDIGWQVIVKASAPGYETVYYSALAKVGSSAPKARALIIDWNDKGQSWAKRSAEKVSKQFSSCYYYEDQVEVITSHDPEDLFYSLGMLTNKNINDNDITFIYFVGHASAPDNYTNIGALDVGNLFPEEHTTNDEFGYYKQSAHMVGIKDVLNYIDQNVPGMKIFIFDSCTSGNAIEDAEQLHLKNSIVLTSVTKDMLEGLWYIDSTWFADDFANVIDKASTQRTGLSMDVNTRFYVNYPNGLSMQGIYEYIWYRVIDKPIVIIGNAGGLGLAPQMYVSDGVDRSAGVLMKDADHVFIEETITEDPEGIDIADVFFRSTADLSGMLRIIKPIDGHDVRDAALDQSYLIVFNNLQGDVFTARSDRGKYHFENLPIGEYIITVLDMTGQICLVFDEDEALKLTSLSLVEQAGYISKQYEGDKNGSITVQSGYNWHDITLLPKEAHVSGTVNITVDGKNFQAIDENQQLTINYRSKRNGKVYTSPIDVDGKYAITELEPGNYTVSVANAGGSTYRIITKAEVRDLKNERPIDEDTKDKHNTDVSLRLDKNVRDICILYNVREEVDDPIIEFESVLYWENKMPVLRAGTVSISWYAGKNVDYYHVEVACKDKDKTDTYDLKESSKKLEFTEEDLIYNIEVTAVPKGGTLTDGKRSGKLFHVVVEDQDDHSQYEYVDASSSEDDIRRLQKMLVDLGILAKEQVTGEYDSATVRAVAAFQKWVNTQMGKTILLENGIADDLTMQYIEICVENNYVPDIPVVPDENDKDQGEYDEQSEQYLYSMMQQKGQVVLWGYADYDGDGTHEAFAVTVDKYDSIKAVWFVDSSGNVERVAGNVDGSCYPGEPGEIETVMDCSSQKVYYVNYGGGGSGSLTLLFSVRNGRPYELQLSRKVQGLFREGDRYYTEGNDFSGGYHQYPKIPLTFDEANGEFRK